MYYIIGAKCGYLGCRQPTPGLKPKGTAPPGLEPGGTALPGLDVGTKITIQRISRSKFVTSSLP